MLKQKTVTAHTINHTLYTRTTLQSLYTISAYIDIPDAEIRDNYWLLIKLTIN